MPSDSCFILYNVSESAKEDGLFSGTLSPAPIESDHPGTRGNKASCILLKPLHSSQAEQRLYYHSASPRTQHVSQDAKVLNGICPFGTPLPTT